MSIVPSDSASRAGESLSEVGHSVSSISPPSDLFMTTLGSDASKYMDKYFAAYQSYCRVTQFMAGSGSAISGSSLSAPAVSSASSSSPSSGGSLSSGSLAAAKMTTARRVTRGTLRGFCRAMRAKGVSSSLPGGYCYTRALRPEAREQAASVLGPYPALGDLLSRPREEFMPLSVTGDLVLELGSDGVAHVRYSTAPGQSSYNKCVTQLAKRIDCDFGTYGQLLRHSPLLDSLPGDFSSVSTTTPVGGSGELRSSLELGDVGSPSLSSTYPEVLVGGPVSPGDLPSLGKSSQGGLVVLRAVLADTFGNYTSSLSALDRFFSKFSGYDSKSVSYYRDCALGYFSVFAGFDRYDTAIDFHKFVLRSKVPVIELMDVRVLTGGHSLFHSAGVDYNGAHASAVVSFSQQRAWKPETLASVVQSLVHTTNSSGSLELSVSASLVYTDSGKTDGFVVFYFQVDNDRDWFVSSDRFCKFKFSLSACRTLRFESQVRISDLKFYVGMGGRRCSTSHSDSSRGDGFSNSSFSSAFPNSFRSYSSVTASSSSSLVASTFDV